jgi:prophage DNA circulation protein
VLPEQLPNESAKAYAAFVAYAEMGSQRSLEKVCQRYAKSIPVLKRWSAQHHWQERVRQYDAAVLEEHNAALRAKRNQEIERLRQDALLDAKTLRQLGRGLSARLGETIKDMKAEDIEPKHVASLLRTVAQSLEAATDIDAAALGVDEALEHARNTDTTE